jgi:transposase
MPYIKAPDRQQLTFMNKLDDLVAPDHPVRLLDAVVDRIICDEMDFFDHLAPDEGVGRRGYPAGCLIKLLLYGYIHRISSSRALAAEAERNIEVIWLLSSLTPSYKTIADYRKDHPDQIARVNEAVVRFLIGGGWIEGQRVAVDGAKLKAYTGWQMSDADRLEQQLEAANSQLEEWLRQLAANDRSDELDEIATEQVVSGEEPPACEPEVMAEIARLHRRIERLETLKEQLAESGAARISPADPEARLMRFSRRGKHPGYNLQAGVDGAHHLIVSATVTNQANDLEQLGPMHAALTGRLGEAPAELLGDTGYAALGDIKQIQANTRTRCYIPEAKSTAQNKSVQFSYEPATDRYRCSAGRTLAPIVKERYHKDKDAWVDTYRGTDCVGCPMTEQ